MKKHFRLTRVTNIPGIFVFIFTQSTTMSNKCPCCTMTTFEDMVQCSICDQTVCKEPCCEECPGCQGTTCMRDMRECSFCDAAVCVSCLENEEKQWHITMCCNYKLLCPNCKDRHVERECDQCGVVSCDDYLDECLCGMSCCSDCTDVFHQCKSC